LYALAKHTILPPEFRDAQYGPRRRFR